MTKTSKQHWAFKLWVKARGFLALSVVLLGVVVGLATLLLPFDSLYKERLEQFLEEQWGMEVSVNEIQGSWKGFGPHFQFTDLELIGKQTVEVADTTLSVNVYEFIIPGGKTGIDLSINQADLGMVQSDEGHNITINNDGDEAKFTEMLDKILAAGALSVSELNLNIVNDQGEALLSGLKAAFILEQDSENRAMSLKVIRDNHSALLIKSIGPKNKQLSKDARWHVLLSDFDVAQFNELQTEWKIPSFILDGELWLKSVDGVLVEAQAQIDWNLGEMSGRLEWLHQGENQHWRSRVKLSGLQSKNGELADINGQLERQGDFLTVFIDVVDLQWINQIISDDIDGWPNMSATGNVSGLRLDYDFSNKKIKNAEAVFLVKKLAHEQFTVSQLGGTLLWHQGDIQLLLDGKDGYFDMPEFIRGKMQWSELISQITIPLNQPNSGIDVNQFWCDCGDFSVDAQGKYWLQDVGVESANDAAVAQRVDDKKRMLQLQARVEGVDVAALHGYWPHNVWNPKTINWLDKGLKSGVVNKGYLFQYGELLPDAYKNKLSSFESRAYLQDVSIQFNPEWPLATNLSGEARFSGVGFSADVKEAKSMDIQLKSAVVSMKSYKQSFIDLTLKAQAYGNAIFEYLPQTPITKNITLDKDMKLSGNQSVALKLKVPLKTGVKVKPQGLVTFNDAGFSTTHLDLNHLKGDVQLDGLDLNIEELDAQLLSHAVKVSGVIKTQTEDGLDLAVQLKGELSAEQLMDQQQIDLPIKGLSEWLISISNPNKQLHINLASDLSGTTIDLPAPLNKSAKSSKLFELDCDIPCATSEIKLNYADEIISRLLTENSGLVIKQLLFKEAVKSASDKVLLGGHISEFDVDNWLGLVKQWSQTNTTTHTRNFWPLPTKSFTLEVDEMLFLARRFYQVKLNVVRLDDAYQIDIDNQSMKGRLLVADDLSSKGVVADFEYLHWKEASIDDLTHTSKVAEKLPDLHIFSQSFSYLGMPFGEMRLEMRNVIDGMRVETMSLISDTSKIQISGDWVASQEEEGGLGISDFSIVMTSERIADFLHQMDFDAPISNAQTLIQLYASWPGTPSMFDLKNIDGTLNLKMGEGEVLDTKPGFGRVLGLFSLTNLPRRLILDFKDVMSEGLHFDSMEGSFELTGGYAETSDFLIKASAANIKVKGLTGFADQSYHQTIIVEPQVGKTFPTLGAIAGGAVGAAAGFFVQGLLNKKLKSENRITYQVTGSWDEPIIEVIEDE